MRAKRLRDRAHYLDDAEIKGWRRIFAIRHVGAVILGTIVIFMSSIGRFHVPAGIFVLTVVVPFSVWADRVTVRNRALPVGLFFFDQIGIVVAGMIFPNAWPGLVPLSLAAAALALFAYGERLGLLLLLGTSLAMSVIAFVTNQAGLLFGVIGYSIGACTLVGAVGGVGRRAQQVRRRHIDLLDSVAAIIWERGLDSDVYTFVSAQAEKMVGYSVVEWKTAGFFERTIHPDDHALADVVPDVLAGDFSNLEREYRMIAADGSVVWIRDLVQVELDNLGTPIGIRGVKVDITRRKRDEIQLTRFSDIVQNIRTGLLVFSFDDPLDLDSMRLVATNAAAARMRGFDFASAAGSLASGIVPNTRRSGLTELVHSVLISGQTVVMERFPVREPDDGPVYEVAAFPLPGDLVGFSFEDVTERRRAELALRRQATLDSLTGLANRSLIHEQIGKAVLMARLHSHPLALLLLDLNSFKEVNDSLGHMTGDLLLREVGNRLVGLVRKSDTVARLGGDEFAILLVNDGTAEAAQALSNRIAGALSEPFYLNGVTIKSQASIGIAVFPDHGHDAASLLQHADVAMYVAKRAGQGSALYEPAHDANSLRRLTLIGELHNSIDRNELVLYYQPKIDLATGKMAGVEALIRWQHSEHGLIMPLEFVGLAEVSGFIKPMTRWVIETGIQQAKDWQHMGLSTKVAVNVSVRNLYEPRLVEWIEERLRFHDLPPSLLQIEITESEIMGDVALTNDVLSRIGGLGVGLSIDDFGTGYSSLSHLRQLPIDEIKIDRSFVSNMLASENDSVIVQSMVNLAHNLGLEVVAEGVEDAQTKLALGAIGCDRAQGFYFSQPIPVDALTRWAFERQFDLNQTEILVPKVL